MSDVNINAILAQRQAIESRRRPQSDFQTTVTDRAGNRKAVWNAKVGGEAAFKAQDVAIDKALDAFDKGPQGSLLGASAKGATTSQKQNDERIDYNKSTLGNITYAAKEAAPWLGIPLGVAETYGVRRAVGLGPGSSATSRIGASVGGLGLSAVEGYLSHRSGEGAKDPTRPPFQQDISEGLSNLGTGASLTNAVGSIISPFIGTGGASKNALAPSAPPAPPPIAPPAPPGDDTLRNDYEGMRPREASTKLVSELGGQPAVNKGSNLAILPDLIKNAEEGKLRAAASGFPGVNSLAETAGVRNALASRALEVLGKTRPLALPLTVGGIGAAMLGHDRAEAAPDGYRPGEDTLRPSPSGASQVVNALARGGDAMRELPGKALKMAPGIAPYAVNAPLAAIHDAASIGDAMYPPSPQYSEEARNMTPGRMQREYDRIQEAERGQRQAAFLSRLHHNPETLGRNEIARPVTRFDLPPEALAPTGYEAADAARDPAFRDAVLRGGPGQPSGGQEQPQGSPAAAAPQPQPAPQDAQAAGPPPLDHAEEMQKLHEAAAIHQLIMNLGARFRQMPSQNSLAVH